MPRLSDVLEPDSNYQYFTFLWAISPPRWSVEAFWLKELENRPWAEKNKPTGGYVLNNYWTDIRMMFLIWIGWCFVSFLGLKLFNRAKQR